MAARGSFEGAVVAYDAEQPLTRVDAIDWADFGHVNTFYRSRARSTTQRSFNELIISDRKVRKTGTPPAKIQAEARWHEALPVELRVYAPQLLCHGPRDHGYVIDDKRTYADRVRRAVPDFSPGERGG